MYELIAMALALTLLVILLHLKVKLGRSMVLAAIGLAALLGVTPSELWQALVNEWHTKPLSQTTPPAQRRRRIELSQRQRPKPSRRLRSQSF